MPEDTNHFLLHCYLFQVSRPALINSITPIVSPYNLIDEINNQYRFLYSHRNISSEDNMTNHFIDDKIIYDDKITYDPCK